MCHKLTFKPNNLIFRLMKLYVLIVALRVPFEISSYELKRYVQALHNVPYFVLFITFTKEQLVQTQSSLY